MHFYTLLVAVFTFFLATTKMDVALKGMLVVSVLNIFLITQFLSLPSSNTSIGAVIYLQYRTENPCFSKSFLILFFV